MPTATKLTSAKLDSAIRSPTLKSDGESGHGSQRVTAEHLAIEPEKRADQASGAKQQRALAKQPPPQDAFGEALALDERDKLTPLPDHRAHCAGHRQHGGDQDEQPDLREPREPLTGELVVTLLAFGGRFHRQAGARDERAPDGIAQSYRIDTGPALDLIGAGAALAQARA